MRRYFTAAVLLLAAAVIAFGASVFAEFQKTEYNITESTSLGGSVQIQNDIIVHQSSGNVSGTVVFNSKTKLIKFTDKRVKYDQASLIIKTVGQSYITSGKGTLLNDGRDVSFQIIEDLRSGNINMIVKWPDYSSVRFIATRKSQTTL